MARLRPEEVQHNQSSKYCAQKAFAARHESPIFCASCKGSLHATDIFYLLSLLTVCIFVGAMLPVIIKVAVISGNGVGHVFAALARKEICFVHKGIYNQVLYFESFSMF